MKFLRILILLILGILTLGFIGSFFINPLWQVTATTTIRATDVKIFPYLNTLNRWPEWTVWNQKTYPDMIMTYEGAESGAGAIQRWKEDNNQGILTITRIVPNKQIQYRLTMENTNIAMQGTLKIKPIDDGTTVTWVLSGNSGDDQLSRLIMLAYRPMIKKDLSASLENLKHVLENPASN